MSLVKCGVTRDGLREQNHPAVVPRQCGASCKALKNAVSSLHRVDDFDLEYIGSGFFSHIYKVVHKITKQVMVLKENIKSSNRPNARREIQLMNQLSHPNIIRFYGVCIIDGHMHALVEYINGGSLEQLLADKNVELPWTLRIHLACDIAKGIKYLHSNGYMHRDLTSKNILIKNYSDGRTAAVVADLGLTDKIPDPDKQVSSVGSPYWMAPECISGKKYNEKADVFSYGIVLCEIIARVEADPDILPRTKKFGVDYVEFSKMSSDCPLHLLHQAFICCQIEPSKRPSFTKIVSSLEEMKSSAQMAVILADLSRLGIVNSGKNVLNRMLLEKILDEKLKHRKRSADDGQQHSIMQTPPSYVVTSRLLHHPPFGGISPSNLMTDPSSGPTNRHQFVPVTPMIVGKVMSRDDVYYAPQQGNPFPVQFRGAKWINPSKDSSRNSFGSSSFDFGDSETDRGILDDCSEFLELHSPMDRLPRTVCSRQKSSDLRQSLHLNCYPPVVLHEFVGSPSNPPSLGRLSGRLQRSNSLPGSPSSLFTQSEYKELSSSKTSTNPADLFKNNCSSNFLTDIDQTIRNKQNFEKNLVSETSDMSEYGSSSLDSALGSELATSKSRRETSDNVLLFNSLNNNREPTQVRKRPEEDCRAVVQRRRHRVSSASVCRSSSTVYPQTEEAALLARYFEIYRRDSSDSSRAQDGDASPFYDDEDGDADELASSLCNYKHNKQQQSPIPFFLSDDSVVGIEDSFEVRGLTDGDLLSRDDVTRRSRERFLELVRNWEGRVDIENASSSSHFHTISNAATGGSIGRPKLMEFAEFYLLRRFQELKQKWEKRQQMFNTGSKNMEANCNSSACPTLRVCEKQLFDSSTSDETIRNSPEKADIEYSSAT